MPKPQKGRNLKPEQKIEIARKVCEMYATDKYTIAACLAANGIETETTWRNWQAGSAEIANLYKEAIKQKADAYKSGLVERARTVLEKHLEGYTIELIDTEGIEEVDTKTGTRRIKTTKVKKRQVYIKPVFQAAEMVLTNMDSENFKKNPQKEDEVSEELLELLDAQRRQTEQKPDAKRLSIFEKIEKMKQAK